MAFSCKKLSAVCLLLMCIQQAYHTKAQSIEDPISISLMCYICDNCPEVDTSTPIEECNAAYFQPKTTTTPDVTESTIPIFTDDLDTTESSTTSTTITTTTTTSSTTTTAPTTVDSTSGESTEQPMPTPPTVGPPQTTTAVPTPTNVGTVPSGIDLDAINNSSLTGTTVSFVPTEDISKVESTTRLVVRQLRQVTNTDVTYHCYAIKRKENGTLITQRGCSRVTTMQGVCDQLKLTLNDTITKCNPCSESLCNSSSALAVSTATLLIAVLALLLNRN